jgi:O-methyltransferase
MSWRSVVRNSLPLQVAQSLSAPILSRVPLQKWPGWVAKLTEVHTQASVKPLPRATPKCGANVNILFDALARTRDIAGDVAECGVYRGATLLAMGLQLEQTKSDKRVFGFDSFSGFDNEVEVDAAMPHANDPSMRVGAFNDTTESRLRRRIASFGLTQRIFLHKGFFKQTLVDDIKERFSFVHLDCDLYESYKDCLAFFYPRMTPGGLILLDEYLDPSWPGCKIATDEFLNGKPETIECVRMNNFEKYWIKKAT